MNRLQKKFLLLLLLVAYVYDLKTNKPVQYFIFLHTIGDNNTPLNTIFNRLIDNTDQPILNNDMIPIRNRVDNLLSWSRTFRQL